MFPMQITLSNIGQLNAVLTALCLDLDAPVVHAAPEPTEPTTAELIQIAQARKDAAAPNPKSAKPRAATTAPLPATAEEAVAAAPEPSTKPPAPQPATAQPAAASSAAEPVTYERVSKAITEGAKANRQLVVDALAKFGAKKGTELAPAQYAEFMAELEA